MSVRYGLLALLDEAPSHGYLLKTAFERSPAGDGGGRSELPTPRGGPPPAGGLVANPGGPGGPGGRGADDQAPPRGRGRRHGRPPPPPPPPRAPDRPAPGLSPPQSQGRPEA